MRIISGYLKGRRLKSFQAKHLRPTTDRVKEVIFNILMFKIEGQEILDLFGGTGNLGIEAISRGASGVTIVESHPQSLKIIKENMRHLGIKEGYKVIGSDVFKFLKQDPGNTYDVIFVDPPFTEKIADKVMEDLQGFAGLKPGTLVFIESGKHEPINDQYGSLKLLERKEFGDKRLSIFEKDTQ